ncbi:MAG: TniB family NTP-binding protein [Phycisphaeraceae bacterium]|nr:TniB family NTP-binding protein [Phycisphaeraceae bacterium]
MPIETVVSRYSNNEPQLDLFDHMQKYFGQHWISYPIAEEGLNRFRRILAYPETNRPPCCLVYGKANAGKSLLCERFMLETNPKDTGQAEASVKPVIMVQTPESPRLSALYSNIIDSLGAPISPTMSTDKKRDQVVNLLRRLQTKIIIIDEIHHILDGSMDKQGQFLNAIKTLTNQLRISIIAVGTEEAHRAIHLDPQFGSRFDPFYLPQWEMGDKYAEFIANLCLSLGFEGIDSVITSQKFIRRLHTMSDGLTGETREIVCRLVELAGTTGRNQLSFDMLAEIRWTSPGDRLRVAHV